MSSGLLPLGTALLSDSFIPSWPVERDEIDNPARYRPARSVARTEAAFALAVARKRTRRGVRYSRSNVNPTIEPVMCCCLLGLLFLLTLLLCRTRFCAKWLYGCWFTNLSFFWRLITSNFESCNELLITFL